MVERQIAESENWWNYETDFTDGWSDALDLEPPWEPQR